jgi:hypothetical protein
MKPLTKRQFIEQQGLTADTALCDAQYSALAFQPRIIAPLVIVGVLLQSPPVFACLGAVLCWSAVFPSWSPFDAAYNFLAGRLPGKVRLHAAPAPRRFAQGMAAAFAAAIAIMLGSSSSSLAMVLEISLFAAVALVLLGRFCLGTLVYRTLFRAR